MKVVFPCYSGDTWLAIKHFEWIAELEDLRGRKLGYHAVIASDDQTDAREVIRSAQQVFGKVGTIRYAKAFHNGKLMTKWPWQQNNSFAHVARAMAKQNESWFWCETDCTALKPGWLQTLEKAYLEGQKPFGGHWNPATQIFNGVAVYPANVGRWCVRALMASLIVQEERNNYQPPWDAYMSKDVYPKLHIMNAVMQHLWSLPDAPDRAPTFPNQEAVTKWIRPEVCIFHRCKDGSLIDRLRERQGAGLQDCHGTDAVHPRLEPKPPEPEPVVIPPPAPPLPNPVLPAAVPPAVAPAPPGPPPQSVPEVQEVPKKRRKRGKHIPVNPRWKPVSLTPA